MRTTLYLTKYEKYRAIGERATMLSKGAKTTLDYKKLDLDIDKMSPLDIAHLELKNKCLPFIIKRKLPNNKNPVFISINKLIDTIINVNE
jgi:DNA-directed RNA polymerase I, II, and III subunit RPABC2